MLYFSVLIGLKASVHGSPGGCRRSGQNRLHTLVGLLRQSVFGRLAGYDNVTDTDRLGFDPVMRQVVGGRCALRSGNVHSADGWEAVLKPVLARYSARPLMRVFRADAAFAIPGL